MHIVTVARCLPCTSSSSCRSPQRLHKHIGCFVLASTERANLEGNIYTYFRQSRSCHARTGPCCVHRAKLKRILINSINVECGCFFLLSSSSPLDTLVENCIYTPSGATQWEGALTWNDPRKTISIQLIYN